MAYAEKTTVSTEKSRAEIERTGCHYRKPLTTSAAARSREAVTNRLTAMVSVTLWI